MTAAEDVHADHGATFGTVGGRRVPVDYGRPDRAAAAVRNGAGVVEMPYGVVAVRGDDRHGFVDDAVSNRVPAADGEGCYALLLSPEGRVETDMYVYVADEQLLCLVPPGRAGPLADDWSGKVFIEDVSVEAVTDDYAILGVHGPAATEAVAGVLSGAPAPDERLSFVRGRVADAGVAVVRTDAPAGETGYEVVCDAGDAADVLDAVLHLGPGAVPFGRATWETLTLEAGTPLFGTELDGEVPNGAGVRNALDFEKGCYVGQEVVSRIENRGRPPGRLVGLLPDEPVERGADVYAGSGVTDGETSGDGGADAAGDGDADSAGDGDADSAGDGEADAANDGGADAAGDGDADSAGDGDVDSAGDGDAGGSGHVAVTDGDVVGTVTRAAESPALDRPVAMARVDYDLSAETVAVGTGGSEAGEGEVASDGPVPAEVAALPLVEGGERSARVPEYP